MRLLFLVPYAPTAIRTRPYHFIKQLDARGHSITLATLWTSAQERESLAEWEALGIQVVAAPLARHRSLRNSLGAIPTRGPLQAVYCWQPTLARALTDLLARQQFDACHVEHLRGALYGKHIQRIASENGLGLRVLWDSVDCISALFEQAAEASHSRLYRIITRLELERTRRFEAQVVSEMDVTVVVTEPERAALLKLAHMGGHTGAEPRVQIVPNGVDSDRLNAPEGGRDAATILFSGKMSYHANDAAAIYLLDEIMPRVWETIPSARVVIVGQNPKKGLLRRAQKDPERIRVTGSVPDIRPFLAKATVACAPMVYGAGVQNKILEAMAMRLPVIATDQAAHALKVENERELLIGRDTPQVSAQLVRALQDPFLRRQLAVNARSFVETQHRWQDSAEKLEALYRLPPV